MGKMTRKIAFVLLLNVIFAVAQAIGASCQTCQGYSTWSGDNSDAGVPPYCLQYASSRALGTCVSGGTGSCVENSKATMHWKTYTAYLPPEKELVCLGIFSVEILMCDGDPACEMLATCKLSQCYETFTECVLASDEYGVYIEGCVS